MKITKFKLKKLIREVLTDIDTGLSRGSGESSSSSYSSPTEEDIKNNLSVIIQAINSVSDDENGYLAFHIDDYISFLQENQPYLPVYSYALDYLDQKGIIQLEGSSGWYYIEKPEFFVTVNYEGE